MWRGDGPYTPFLFGGHTWLVLERYSINVSFSWSLWGLDALVLGVRGSQECVLRTALVPGAGCGGFECGASELVLRTSPGVQLPESPQTLVLSARAIEALSRKHRLARRQQPQPEVGLSEDFLFAEGSALWPTVRSGWESLVCLHWPMRALAHPAAPYAPR